MGSGGVCSIQKKKERKGKKKLIGKESHERDIRLHFSRKFSVRAQTYRKFGACTLKLRAADTRMGRRLTR
jgi:hypothetical protein